MKTLISISRLITGAVFVFSGFVKAVDPLGSTYKFTDYFVAFHIQFLEPIALALAVILASIEFLIGISMLIGYRYRIASWGLLIFMVLFHSTYFYSCTYKSRIRLRMFRRCHNFNQLANIY